jgi:regulation of enolase protein 1 (concanavalin A-like superfamily)
VELTERFRSPSIPEPFYWFNEPARYEVGAGLEILTDAETDFWQNTHYGFRRDNGHCLFVRRAGDFALATHVEFRPRNQYDQCGLMVRADANNWIKLSTEFESETCSRLGSVVTNLGFSDWATQDISSDRRAMWYRISRSGSDFLLQASFDGQDYQQLRITHLHRAPDELEVGVYACSPLGRDFWCRFDRVEVSASTWSHSSA